MTRLTCLATSTRTGARAAALVLSVLLALTAAGAPPARAGGSASAVTDPASRCDQRSAAQIEQSFELGYLMPISSRDDDPFVHEAIVEHAPLALDGAAQGHALVLLDQARRLGLAQHGAPLSIVRKADGDLGVEARVLRGDGPNVWLETFTPDAPHGRRRPIVSKVWGGDQHAAHLEHAGIVLTADELDRLR